MIDRVKHKSTPPIGHTRVSPKHQITIPREAMRLAGLSEGDRLDVVDVEHGKVVLVRADDPTARFAGCLTGVYPPDALDTLRNEWD